jgi:predicted glutamine amidotransferase
MCQLLGMNGNVPTDICFSFKGFACRGGRTDHHSDGWGIAFFEGQGCRLFLDYLPSATSPVAELVQNYPIKSTNIIAHIRKATQGVTSLANTHPFQRELWGQYWIFAHNGDLKGLPPVSGEHYRPVGNTDSEHAFCLILEQLRQRFAVAPPLPELSLALAEIVRGIAGYGVFNMMLSNGEWLFAHCATKLHYLVRQAPFAVAQLKDEDLSVDFSALTAPDDRVAVIVTEPLTANEPWRAMQPGELLCFRDGLPHAVNS